MDAREEAVSEKNILAGWKGATLFPENLGRILQQFADNSEPITPPPNPTPIVRNGSPAGMKVPR